MKTLTLTGVLKGKTRKCGNHVFEDGKLELDDVDADKVYRAINRFYPVEINEPVAPVTESVTDYVQDAGAKIISPNVEAEVKPAPKTPTVAASQKTSK